MDPKTYHLTLSEDRLEAITNDVNEGVGIQTTKQLKECVKWQSLRASVAYQEGYQRAEDKYLRILGINGIGLPINK